jgi:hypothetical protein
MNDDKPLGTLVGSTKDEVVRKHAMAERLRRSPIPDGELMDNLGVYLTRQNLSRMLFIQEIYAQILPVHGVIMEFGVRWGQNLSLFSNLRGIYEPFNYNRRIVGFDTFAGFPSVSAEDGALVASGDYAVTGDYVADLTAVLEYHQANAPIPHKRKFELVQGDASQTLPAFLGRHPETIVALAYFDFDIHAPTKSCLEALLPHCTRGTVLAFDELNCPEFPGETTAVKEVLGLGKYALRRVPHSPLTSYLVIE